MIQRKELRIENPPDRMRPPPVDSRLLSRKFAAVWASSSRLLMGASSRGGIIVLAIQIVGAIVSYFAQVYLARSMGRATFGVYTYIMGWAMTLSIVACFGLHQSALRFVPGYLAGGDWARLRGITKRSLQLLTGSACLIGVIWAVVVWNVAPRLYREAFLIAAFAIFFATLTRVQANTLRALGRVATAVAADLLLRPIILLVGVFCAARLVTTFSATDGVVCYTVALVVAALLLTTLVQLRLPRFEQGAVQRYEIRALVYSSLALAVGGLLVATWGETDLLLSGYLLGPEAIGPYQAARRTTLFSSFCQSAVITAVAPAVSSDYEQKRMEELQARMNEVTHLTFWPTLALAVVLGLLAKPILGLFGRGFTAARGPLIILLLGELISVGTGSVGMLLQLTEYQYLNNVAIAVTIVAELILGALLIPTLRLEGAALAAAGAQVVGALLRYRVVATKIGLRFTILQIVFRGMNQLPEI